ncbi:hypothetical protein N0V90_000089 [Kalmusia sp. IMI 367209]|nr:hypothetical protein N0V90_000089 [Kalmusia sp. IMI 367209]
MYIDLALHAPVDLLAEDDGAAHEELETLCDGDEATLEDGTVTEELGITYEELGATHEELGVVCDENEATLENEAPQEELGAAEEELNDEVVATLGVEAGAELNFDAQLELPWAEEAAEEDAARALDEVVTELDLETYDLLHEAVDIDDEDAVGILEDEAETLDHDAGLEDDPAGAEDECTDILDDPIDAGLLEEITGFDDDDAAGADDEGAAHDFDDTSGAVDDDKAGTEEDDDGPPEELSD